MKQGLHQHVSLKQELRANPRLYQAMDLLYMPLLDLQQHLKQELLVNPFLEMVESYEEDDRADDAADSDADSDSDPEGDVDTEAATESENEGDQDGEGDDEGEGEGEGDGEGPAAGDAEADRVEVNAESADDTAAVVDGVDWEEVLLEGFDVGGMRAEREDSELPERASVEKRNLGDYLREQLALLNLSPRQQVLADEFVGDIGESGYLMCGIDTVLASVNSAILQAATNTGRDDSELPIFTLAEATAMLEIIQALDPPGVAARNLQECLLLQLREAGHQDSIAAAIVRDLFDDLVAHRWGDIAKRLGVSSGTVQDAADAIKKLDPKPGLRFGGADDNYVTPDLIVERIDGAYAVFINDGNLPRLRLSRIYRELARDKRQFVGENKEFITNKLNSATWMVQAIEQRRQTMLKVMNFIVDRQRDFFERGVQGLKPLTLREVAEVIGMHESTVSRVTNEKFVQTPRGVLPLKFFFSSGLSTAGGEDVSARGVKAQIQKLVAAENAEHPLTDQNIVDELKQTGLRIARRTVAKYRDELGVLSARMRKRV